MTRHKLKILPQYFEAQVERLKFFELRKNDRNFRVWDEIELIEIDNKLGEDYKPTGRTCLVRITYILASFPGNEFEGLEPGYAILSTEVIS